MSLGQFPVTVAVVGDVHGLWSTNDERQALEFLKVNCTLLLGDFGEEDVQLVESIGSLPLPKAAILGNHDAWSWRDGRRDNRHTGNREALERQLRALGECHVGYGSLAIPQKPVTVVGSRPFSWGGPQFDFMATAYDEFFGVRSMQQSAKRIASTLQAAPTDHSLIVIAHNGPKGLGDEMSDICGVDFRATAGDWGDPDLADGLQQAAAAGRVPALVTFGHMHDQLTIAGSIIQWVSALPYGAVRRGTRRRVVVDERLGTVHLNAAVVPRVKSLPRVHSEDGSSYLPKARHFCVVTLQEWGVETAKDVWVEVQEGGSCRVAEELELLRTESVTADSVTRAVMDTRTKMRLCHSVTSPRVTCPDAAAEVGQPGWQFS